MFFACIAQVTITSTQDIGGDDHTTYSLKVYLQPAAHNIYAVYGDPVSALSRFLRQFSLPWLLFNKKNSRVNQYGQKAATMPCTRAEQPLVAPGRVPSPAAVRRGHRRCARGVLPVCPGHRTNTPTIPMTNRPCLHDCALSLVWWVNQSVAMSARCMNPA